MRASVDIGSNSLLLLVVDAKGVVLHDEARVVGLGRGLGERGMFRPDRMEAALGVLADYAATAARHGVRPEAVRAVATSASRRAMNAATFYAGVRTRTGLRVEVVSGDEEARLTWRGGTSGLELPDGPVLLCDPGGGSTEVVLGEGDVLHARISLEVGTVRLTERYLGYGLVDPVALARLRAHVDTEVEKVRLPTLPRAAIAVAGTATTLAAMELGLPAYDGARVHGTALTVGALRTWTDRLLAGDPDARRAWARPSPERADTLLAGAVILLAVLERARRPAWRVSDRGLRWALVS